MKGLFNYIYKKKNEKEAGAKTIIVEVILIVVAVAICVFFKSEIMSVISELMGDVSTNIKGIF